MAPALFASRNALAPEMALSLRPGKAGSAVTVNAVVPLHVEEGVCRGG